MARRKGWRCERVEGEKAPVETGPGRKQVGRGNGPCARRTRRPIEREVEWYDERIGRSWDVGTGRGGEKGRESQEPAGKKEGKWKRGL